MAKAEDRGEVNVCEFDSNCRANGEEDEVNK
jgi:hypothetical protein